MADDPALADRAIQRHAHGGAPVTSGILERGLQLRRSADGEAAHAAVASGIVERGLQLRRSSDGAAVASGLIGGSGAAGAPVQRMEREGASSRAHLPDSTPTNTAEIKTDDYRYVVNGHVAGRKDASFAQPGDVRYVRTDGVGNCVAFALRGTRSDGAVVSLFAHLSSQQTGDAAGRYAKLVASFADGLTDVQAMAVTNYVSDKKAVNGAPAGRYSELGHSIVEAIGPELYNTEGLDRERKPAPYRDFLFDAEQFDIHAVGQVRHGVAAVLESVTSYQREEDRQRQAWQAWRSRMTGGPAPGLGAAASPNFMSVLGELLLRCCAPSEAPPGGRDG